MKNKTLKILYDFFNKPTFDKNPFMPYKEYMRLQRLLVRYVPKDQQDEAIGKFEKLCDICQKNAFELGFYTALSLFLKS